ncbi:T9SS type A sorting domain-containing protein [Paracrocinitomix mangrovi]|uniref:T9SS type A sorting domain-containing protein n=1 Tax=Paracrocinitomix mangrovi TaxID=2862509 RepID=UPI001C8EDDAA|nr:T9SS type A sorting domain-containing protein [Paracrocinitomix mangrovi]UKN03523.1 T9SS type A sorting domain-containing protein [Paracrocinitomix mangrovi]
MKALFSIIAVCAIFFTSAQDQQAKITQADLVSQLKINLSISNCETISLNGSIECTQIQNAISYEFYLNNMNTGNDMTIVSNSNSISLNEFASIITYGSSYYTKVRATYQPIEGEPITTEWSEECEFSLEGAPKVFSLENVECGQEITTDFTISCTPYYIATCYEFHVTNVTTGQNASTGCITQNNFVLASLGITFNTGDVISVYVTYFNGDEALYSTRACEFRIGEKMKLCYVEQIDYFDPIVPSTKASYNVGNFFQLNYFDSNFSSQYATGIWESNSADVINTAIEVLEDIDNFLSINIVDPSCGNINQRLSVTITPFTQGMAQSGNYSNALGIAQIQNQNIDQNYLGQNCSSLPMVHWAVNQFPYGDNSSVLIGYVRLNHEVDNFFMDYPNPTSPNEFDLYTVILHEVIHLLGINESDPIFQEFLFASGNQQLYNSDLFNCTQHADYINLRESGCDNVHFQGQYTNDEVFAPSPYNASSLSHFVDNCGSNYLGENVMNPFLDMGNDQHRFLHQREVNALQDMGYNFLGNFNGQAYNLNNNFPVVVGNNDGLLAQFFNDEGFNCNSLNYSPISQEFCSSNWPLILSPLTNDINANYIDNAVLKTGQGNATINLINNSTQIEFTPNQPGVYTIGYIPANNTRKGLPTYIQIFVPSCNDTNLQLLTCHNSNNCNQICFNDIYSHTLLRGSNKTTPQFFTGSDNPVEIKCTGNHQYDQNSPSTSCYSSVFFWVDTDINEEYSLSFERIFNETPASNAEIEVYAYLVKSTDMMNGQVNQSSNLFTNFPTNNQLVYKEHFATNQYPNEKISICFNANDEYDMLLFYCEQVNNFSGFGIGKFLFKNLEFMKKETPSIAQYSLNCLNEDLILDASYCSSSNSIYTWEDDLGNILSNSQFYNGGPISSPFVGDYTFYYSQPNLPITVITPANNNNCSGSISTQIEFVECCTDGSLPIHHPLTPEAGNRTYGEDVDADNANNLYYTGTFSEDVGFGWNQLQTSNDPPNHDGFIAKFSDNCQEWLVQRENATDNQIKVDDSGNIFWASRGDLYGESRFQRIDPSNGNPMALNWTLQPGSYISDFTLNELNQKVIITGYAVVGETFMGWPIDPGTFIVIADYNSSFISAESWNSPSNKRSKISFKPSTSTIALAYQPNSSEWLVIQDQQSNIGNPNTETTIESFIITSGQAEITSLEYDSNTSGWFTQFVYDGSVSNLTYYGTPKVAICKTDYWNNTTQEFTDDWSGYFSTLYTLASDRPNMHIDGQNIYHSYSSNLFAAYNIKSWSHSTSNFNVNWSNSSISSTGMYYNTMTKGIKNTPLGTFLTGYFNLDLNVASSGNWIYANQHITGGEVATMYGIKYDNTGQVTAMVVPGDNQWDNSQNNGNKMASNHENEEKLNTNAINLYPNPGKDVFTIECMGSFNASILNTNGQEVLKINGIDKSTFNLSDFASGVYIVKVQIENSIEIIKLVKE